MIVCLNCSAQNADDAARCVSCGESPTLPPKTISAGTPRDPAATATGFTFPTGDVPAPVAAPGTRIGSRYELTALLGRGGMGLVYRARDLVLNEDTAIKLLQPHLMREVGDLERLKREITTARKITHPNVIRIHDFGLAGDEGFISMEILTGGTLHERLQKGQIPIPEAVQIALGIADGLGGAHAQGVIHRDIKPHNVLFDAAGTPKLADFGLARLASATSQTMGFSGTPQYMSPELADGREITPRSDVYSAGVLFYELLAGKPPFQADSLLRLANLHSKEPPPPLRAKRPDVPPLLEQIVMKALAKDPAHRFADGRELAKALRDYIAGGTVVLPRPPSAAGRNFAIVAGVLCCLVIGVFVLDLDEKLLGRDFGATPTPVAAPTLTVAVVTVTATPASSATPVSGTPPTNTPRATPTRTPAARPSPAASVLAIAPTPTPVPVAAKGLLSVTCKPWCEVWIDGVRLAEEDTGFKEIEQPAGKHKLRVRNPPRGIEATQDITIAPGKHLDLSVDIAAQTFTPK